MKQNKVKVELLPHTPFLKYNGKFDRNTAIEYCGKIAGECYEPDGWETLKNEDENKTKRRVELTLGLEHSTPYEHVNIGFEITNAPKILLMALNNERQCATSEKSLRYTSIEKGKDPNISGREVFLYQKWMNILKSKIKDRYGDIYSDNKIQKLAQENSRYLTSV
ncbi:MAG: FAD-dependent thymidylate synthase, partial [Bacilli bacterium]|nr:FAD-dependent thymidylate synthase [Bacilli bacterium]